MLPFLSTALVFLGVWFIRNKDIRGQYAMLGAQVGWGVYAVQAGETWLLVQSIVLFVLTLDAVRLWRKED